MLRHVLIWLLLLVLVPVTAPLFLSPDSLSMFVRKDYQQAVSILGDRPNLDDSLKALYRSSLRAVAGFADEFRDKNDDSQMYRDLRDKPGDLIAGLPARWANMVKLQAYSLALRLAILGLWLPWLAAPLAFALAAGLLTRRLKHDTFAPPSPPVYNTALHGMTFLLGLLVFWVASPVPMPLAWLPSLAGFFAYLLSLAVANYPS